MPPDDGRPIDDVLFGLGFENSVGIRTDYLIADGEGTNACVVDWPFERADFAELGGRLFALTGRFDQELELWVTDDLETWDQLAVPAGIAQDGFSSLVSDGSTMVLSTFGPFGPEGPLVTNQPMWITTDGITWTARETALVGHETWGPDATEFGWIEFHDAHSGDDAVNSSPSIAISADAETWQIPPIPGGRPDGRAGRQSGCGSTSQSGSAWSRSRRTWDFAASTNSAE